MGGKMQYIPWVLAAATAVWFAWMARKAERSVVQWTLTGAVFGLVTATIVLGLCQATGIPFSDHERTVLHLESTAAAALIIAAVGWVITLGLHRQHRALWNRGGNVLPTTAKDSTASRSEPKSKPLSHMIEKAPKPKKDDLIVLAGGGGFIAGALARYFRNKGFTRIRAVDKKPLPEWYQRVPGVECLTLDLSEAENCERACEGAAEVYNFAADMGGMGFIERFRVECLRSILINTHLIEAAYRAGARRYFFSSSACVYNTTLQQDPKVTALKEADAYPAMAERGYGWEKLLFGDVLPGILGRARTQDGGGPVP